MTTIDDLQAASKAAQQELAQYSTAITEKYRAEMPVPEGWKGLPDPQLLVQRAAAWTEEERAELGRLRKTALDAALAIHRAKAAGDAA